MNVTMILGLLVLGLVAGVMSSLVGIGGGIIIVPSLMFMFAMNQKLAQGTSLVMLLPPVGVLGVINYYKAGYVDFKIATVLIIAFIAGSYFGSKLALTLPDLTLKRIFGILLAALSVKYLFFAK